MIKSKELQKTCIVDLKRILREKKVRQNRLSEQSGVPLGIINRLANGKAIAIQLGAIRPLCETLGVTPSDLFTFVDPEPES